MASNEIVPTTGKKNLDANPKPAKKPNIQALGVEQGTETVLPFSLPFNPVALGVGKNKDEELQEIIRDESEDTGPTVRQLVAMRRMDGQARALYRLLVLPIRSALSTSSFVPADDGEAEAEFIEQVFTIPPESGGMTVTFHRFMSQMLQGLFDGFSAFEKVFWQPDFGPLQGKITLKKIAHRPAETVTFLVDKQGSFAGLRQRAFNAGKTVDAYIPKENAFYFAAQEEERKFYGVSFFQSAFYHYDKKVRMYFTAHIAAQRAAVGTRVGTVPPNATVAAKQEFATAMSNLAVAQWMMMPDGFKVEVLKESGNYDFLAQINHHNSQMSKSILAPFFDKEQGGGQNEGSLVNFAQPGDAMFILMLRSVMDDIANQINHYIIPQLIDYNFPGGKYPTFTWGKLTDEQKAAISSTFDKLLGTPGNVTPEFVRALEEHQAAEFGLDIDYDEVDQREQEEKEAQEAANIGPDGQPIDPNADIEQPQVDADGNPIDPAAPADPNAPTDPAAPAPAPSPAPAEDEQSAPKKAGASPATPAAPNPAALPPADPSAPAEPAVAEGEDWDLQEFFKHIAKGGQTEDPNKDEIDDFERQLSLTSTEGGNLLLLAQEMIDMAMEDINA